MDLSVVTTMYRSAPYLAEFYERIVCSINRITEDYEVIFVNDGSPDNSLAIALDLQKKDERIKIIDLSRNFGHHKAVMTGLSYAQGKRIFMIDCDLEEDPALIEEFWPHLGNDDAVDVVYGKLRKRKGGWFEKITGSLFFKFFNMLSDTKVPPNFAFCRLASKRYVDALLQYRETEIFIGGIWYHAGFEQKAVEIDKKSRGSSTYTFRKKVALFVNALTSFSNKPLVYIFVLGIVISGISLFTILALILGKIFWGIGLTGWTSLVVSLWLVGGIIIFSIGILGIYLSKIFLETKNRPYTIVRKVYSK